ncbi:autotransporter domain-containing protein [Neisseriaceae bacterium TC5R-5]|nr:autotransporter domain-containing protein [Neisseriaceae bacterium TC5R-5]
MKDVLQKTQHAPPFTPSRLAQGLNGAFCKPVWPLVLSGFLLGANPLMAMAADVVGTVTISTNDGTASTAAGDTLTGDNGAAGLVISGSNNTYTNAGGIYGGAGSADAVIISGSNNRFVLNDGYNFDTGFVNATSGTSNILVLGGSATNGAFDISEIGAVYLGFSGYEKSGSGSWALEGDPVLGVSTNWSLKEGTLSIANANVLNGGVFTFNGGTLANSANITNYTGGIILEGDGTIQTGLTSARNMTISSQITGNGSLTKTGLGTLTLSASNLYQGATNITQGTLLAGTNDIFATSSAVTVNGATTIFNIGTFNQSVKELSGTGTINLGTTALATLTANNNTNLTLSGRIIGSGNFTKTGTGTLTFSNASTTTPNNYTGSTTVAAGTLLAGAANVFAQSAAVNVATDAVLNLNDFAQTANNLSGAGSVLLGSAALTANNNGSSTSNFSGVISGSGSLIKTGTGTLTLGGVNTYTGNTSVNVGTLQAGVVNALAQSAAVSVATDAILDLNNLAQNISSLSGAGSVLLGSAALTANNNGSSTSNFSGVISGSGSLIKTGTGTLTLGGVNTYTGDTNINVGTLQAGAGSVFAQSAAVTVADDATLDLNNTSQLAKQLSGTADSTITLGTSGALTAQIVADTTFAGTLTGTGTSSLNKTGTGTFSLTGNSNSVGSISVSAGTLSLDQTGTLNTLGSYTTQNGATTNINSTGGKIIIGGAFTQVAGSTLNVTLDGDSVGPTITAASAVLAGKLNVTGFNSGATPTKASEAAARTYTLIQSVADITGAFDAPTDPSSLPDYLLGNGVISTDKKSYNLGFFLAWTNGNANTEASTGASTGNFTLTAPTDSFEVDVALARRTDVSGTAWDGNSLTKLGAGTLILSADNSYTGTTTVSAGTLQIGNGGTVGSVAGDISIAEKASLLFKRSNALTYDGVVSGAGSLTQAGTGTLILTGTNTYTGNTNINAGTLQAGANSVFAQSAAVTVAGDATLNLNNTSQTAKQLSGTADSTITLGTSGALTAQIVADTAFAGKLTGTGSSSLNKTGTGTFNLTSNSNSLGSVTVSGGTLSLNQSGALTTLGNYTTKDGASTTISTDTGSLNVGGVFTQEANSVLNVALGSAPAVVANTASLNGTLNLLGFAKTFDNASIRKATDIEGQNYVVIHTAAADGISGDFVTANPTLGNSGLDYLITEGSVDRDRQNYSVGFKLAWNQSSLDKATGSFTLAEGTAFNVDVALADQTGPFTATGWDGKTLTKNGAGTLVLSAVNTYTGGTKLNGGILQVAANNNLGDAAGALSFDGGTLQTTSSFGTARAVTLGTNGGTFDVTGDLNVTGVLSGTGNLSKAGSGTLILANAANTYSGDTLINTGTLQGGVKDAFAKSANVTVSQNATLNLGGFDQTANNLSGAGSVLLGSNSLTANNSIDTTFSGVIASSAGGNLIKNGDGLLVLSAINTYTGGTTINGGTLQAFRDENLGDVAGALNFNGGTLQATTGFASSRAINVADGGGTLQVDGGTFAINGVLSGSGNLTKNGMGNLDLVNGASGLSGKLTVNGGEFKAGGSLGGALEVSNGATLEIVRPVIAQRGGRSSAGGQINTLTVAGDITLNNAMYKVQVNNSEASDLWQSAGKAAFANSTVSPVVVPGDYSTRDYTYKIISADQGVTQAGLSLLPNIYPLLTLGLVYDANNVYLTLSANKDAPPIRNFGKTPNQRAAGDSVDSLSVNNRLSKAMLVQLDEAAYQFALDQVSGEIYASLKSALIEDNHFIRDAANDRLRSGFSGAPGDKAYNAQGQQVAVNSPDQVFWLRGFGAWGSLDGNDNSAKMTRDLGGVVFGSDLPVANWRLGLLGGYSKSNMEVDARNAKADSDNYHLGFYAGTQLEKVLFRSGIIYNWHDLSVNRSVLFPNYSESVSSSYKANSLQVFGELGLPQQWGKVAAEPFVNVTHINLRTKGFGEIGQEAALQADSQTTNVSFSTLGLRLSQALETSTPISLKGQLGWRHAFGDTTPESTQRLAGGSSFTTEGTPIAKDSGILELGAEVKLSRQTTFSFSYYGLYSGRSRENGFTAHVNWLF